MVELQFIVKYLCGHKMKLNKPLCGEKTLGFGDKLPHWVRHILNKPDHDGIDYEAEEGTKVINMTESGYVSRIGYDNDGLKYVIVYHLTKNNNVFFVIYRHLRTVLVKDRDPVNNTTVIGEVGHGRFEPHLHVSLYGAIDPEKYLEKGE